MYLFKRFALSTSLRNLGVFSLLAAAPCVHADIEGGGPLFFDVPEPGETITINLLQLQQLDPDWFVATAEFQVAGVEQADRFLNTSIVAEYCVTIANSDVQIGDGDERLLNISAIRGTPTGTIQNGTDKASRRAAAVTGPETLVARLAVIDDENIKGVSPNDPSCRGASQPSDTLTVNAGEDINRVDTDAIAGELIQLDVSNSTNVPSDAPVTYQFFLNPGSEDDGTPIGTGAVLNRRFDDGASIIRVVAIAGDQRASDDVRITVAPPQAFTVDLGDINQADTDATAGELITLDATNATNTPAGVQVTVRFFLNPSGQSNGTLIPSEGAVLRRRFDDGRSVVRVVASMGEISAADDVAITIGPRQAATLANLPNLTPNQRRTAVALDDVCSRLLGMEAGALTGTITSDGPVVPSAALTSQQLDLTDKCRGIVFNNSVDNQVEAVVDITPEDFAVARTQALLFANTQYTSTLDRLIALRGGARGLSLAGLNIVVDGQNVPVAAIQSMVGKILGDGASADAVEEPGGLLSDRWGMWMRGNYSTGSRDRSLVSPSFDADQMGVIFGTDYRLSRNSVIGASIAYLDSSIDFNPSGEGSLDTESMALSVYGSLYAAKSFYLDALVSYAMADYDALRNISYTQGSSLGDLALDASGSTKGDTVSGGLFGGYDFAVKGITISPNLGFFYVDATIDGFTEDGAGGFNLLYDEQNFKSLTSNIGFRVNASWNLPWVVLLPGLRFDFIREFEDDVDAFQVRFSADPNGMSAAPITIQTDNPDTSYTRLSLNLSAQFKFGFAGYVEYQRIDSFNQIDFQDLAFGFRMQRSF